MKVVTRYVDEVEYFLKLNQLGIEASTTKEDEFRQSTFLRQEEQIGDCVSPPLLCANGDMVRTVELNDEQAELLPMVIEEPFFVVDWRNDEFETVGMGDYEREQLMAWPEYPVAKYDEDGNPDGTRMQGAGIIL